MKIRIIEDYFQYRVNAILHKFAEDFECKEEFEKDAETALWNYRKELGEYFANDISQYCGAQEAYNSES